MIKKVAKAALKYKGLVTDIYSACGTYKQKRYYKQHGSWNLLKITQTTAEQHNGKLRNQ